MQDNPDSYYNPAQHNPGWMRWTGWAITIVVTLFLVLDTGMKLAVLPVVGETLSALGWSDDPFVVRGLGILLGTGMLLYLWPRTAILGAILLTGYLGGAVATHARLGNPLPTHTLFGVYIGVLIWASLWLRLPALRAMIPFMAQEEE